MTSSSDNTCAHYKYGIMLRSKSKTTSALTLRATNRLYKVIRSHHALLNKRFPNITIPNKVASDKYFTIFFEHEKEHDPLILYIKARFTPDIVHRHKHQIIDKFHFVKKINQYKTWSNNTEHLQHLKRFLISNKYCHKQPTYRHTNNYKSHELSWNLKYNCDEQQMLLHWNATAIPLKLHKSNYNQYICQQKGFANTKLQQIYWKSTLEILNNHANHPNYDIIRGYTKLSLISLKEKDIEPLSDNDIPFVLYQYPFLQLFQQNIEPKAKIFHKQFDMSISCHNIGGGAKNKLTKDHPYIATLLRNFNPHIINFLDTRSTAPPDFEIPGYTLIGYCKGDIQDTMHNIGGILSFRRNDVSNLIEVFYVNHDCDMMILKIHHDTYNNYVIIGYCRPCKIVNLRRINRFYNTLNQQINRIKQLSDNHRLIIMGDLNSRLGPIINDHGDITPSGRKLKQVIANHNLHIVNNKFTPGYMTYSKRMVGKLATSIIDISLSDNTNLHVQNFKIDQNKIYKDHKPIIIYLKHKAVRVFEMDPIYSFHHKSSENKDIINDNIKFLQKANKILIKLINNFSTIHNSDNIISQIVTNTAYYILFNQLLTPWC